MNDYPPFLGVTLEHIRIDIEHEAIDNTVPVVVMVDGQLRRVTGLRFEDIDGIGKSYVLQIEAAT